MKNIPTIRDYFNAFMRDVKDKYVFPDHVNEEKAWDFFRTIAEDDKDKIQKVQQATHNTLKGLNKHSFFIWPHPAVAEGNSKKPPLPSGHLKNGIAYISLPICTGAHEERVAYARKGHALVSTFLGQGPVGAIINLSENYGGDCHPMIATLSPLLDDECFVGWADAQGKIISGLRWDYKKGYARNNGELCTYMPRFFSAQNKSIPVAVIYGDMTCSSGEVAALALKGNPLSKSFGQATAGFSTVNSVLRTPFPEIFGEGEFALTVAIMADRHGQVYGDRINPDVLTDKPLSAASHWIKQQTTKRLTQAPR